MTADNRGAIEEDYRPTTFLLYADRSVHWRSIPPPGQYAAVSVGRTPRPIEPLEKVIHEAIEEWLTTEGGPVGHPGEPTLAHYVATKTREFLRALKDWADV